MSRYQEAAPCYLKCIELEPNDASFHQDFGRLCVKLKKPDLVLKHMEIAYNLDPTEKDHKTNYGTSTFTLYSQKAYALQHAGKFPEAHRMLDKLEQEGITVFNLRGLAYHKQRMWKEALFQFETYLELEPGDITAIEIKGDILVELQRGNEAVQFYREIFRKFPNLQDSLAYNFANICIQTNHFQEAIIWLDKVISAKPLWPDAYFKKGENKYAKRLKIGIVYSKMEKPTEAIYWYKKCLEFDPGNKFALFNTGSQVEYRV